MSDGPGDGPKNSAERVVEHQEKFNISVQSEEEEAESQRTGDVEHFAGESDVRKKNEELM